MPAFSPLFDVIDSVRDLLGSQAWASVVIDLSKNDFLALLFVYRQESATMSQIAEYLGVPANTVTGVASRLQKRGLVERTHSEHDRRVVTLTVTDAGIEVVSAVIRQLSRYQAAIVAELTNDELRTLTSVADKVVAVLREPAPEPTTPPPVRRITIE